MWKLARHATLITRTNIVSGELESTEFRSVLVMMQHLRVRLQFHNVIRHIATSDGLSTQVRDLSSSSFLHLGRLPQRHLRNA